ncbi:hypothetical protein SK128_011577 [Halocaridina rubra]|uniref:Uncharacterized protein n=1 Tax=Halocaridina rubra TaxID=373956 RepID=A0AAN8XH40_HALRR
MKGVNQRALKFSSGLAFIKGTPEMLSDMVSSDPMVSREIRRCTLKSTGLLSPDMNINRPALGAALNASLTTPALSAASVAAAYSCPEPVDFKITEFMNCIKSACMSNVVVNPYMTLGTSGPYPGNPNVGSSYQGGSPPAGAWVMQSTSE